MGFGGYSALWQLMFGAWLVRVLQSLPLVLLAGVLCLSYGWTQGWPGKRLGTAVLAACSVSALLSLTLFSRLVGAVWQAVL